MRTQRAAVVITLLALTLSPCASRGKAQDSQSRSLEEAARLFIRNQVPADTLEELYDRAARMASLSFRAEMQAALERPISEREKQRLDLFWYQKIKELLPYSVLEDLCVPIITEHLTLDELREINRFFDTPVGKKLASVEAAMTKEAKGAGEELGRRMSDTDWMAATVEDLKVQFPEWFPDSAEDDQTP